MSANRKHSLRALSPKQSAIPRTNRISIEAKRAARLHEVLQGLRTSGAETNAVKAFQNCRTHLAEMGIGMSVRQFSRVLKAWRKEPCANHLFRKKFTKRWGLVNPQLAKREEKRAEVVHGIFTRMESNGFSGNLSEAFRHFGRELGENRIFVSGKTFSRMFHKWRADRSFQSLMRHRRQGYVISEVDCRAVFDHAMRKGISLEDAVDCLKATPGAQRIPSAATVRTRLPWAAPLISFARKYNLIVTPRGSNV